MINNSLWLAALGLMLASSGIDGAYMSKMMEPALWPLGYVLNTVSDVSGMIIIYWFGRLRQDRKGSKRYRLAIALLPAELIAVGYSWFFSWRQLIIVLPNVEGQEAYWVAPIAAGFTPHTAGVQLGGRRRSGKAASRNQWRRQPPVKRQRLSPLRQWSPQKRQWRPQKRQ